MGAYCIQSSMEPLRQEWQEEASRRTTEPHAQSSWSRRDGAKVQGGDVPSAAELMDYISRRARAAAAVAGRRELVTAVAGLVVCEVRRITCCGVAG
jgi:hypothetical protein